MKRKKIMFRRTYWNIEGRQDSVIYQVHADRTLVGPCAPAYSVSTYDTKRTG